MSKINLTDEILKHTDEEIIEYLTDEMATIKRLYTKATKEKAPELLYVTATNLDDVYRILVALNGRNKGNDV